MKGTLKKKLELENVDTDEESVLRVGTRVRWRAGKALELQGRGIRNGNFRNK